MLDAMQADLNNKDSTNEASSSGSSVRHSDLSLQIPPRSFGFGNSRNGKYQSPGIPSGSSSPGGLLRGLSLKKKLTKIDAERSFLLSSDPKTAPASPSYANSKSTNSWQRCSSLPVTPASKLSPSTSLPASARTYGEQSKSRVSSC